MTNSLWKTSAWCTVTTPAITTTTAVATYTPAKHSHATCWIKTTPYVLLQLIETFFDFLKMQNNTQLNILSLTL